LGAAAPDGDLGRHRVGQEERHRFREPIGSDVEHGHQLADLGGATEGVR
jgi:hypothetical protein